MPPHPTLPSHPLWPVVTAVLTAACATGGSQGTEVASDASAPDDASMDRMETSVEVQPEKPPGPDALLMDLATEPTAMDPDAACATALEQAATELMPVDIIWMVDNSVSMKPAVEQVTAGLNAFAELIAGKSLDFRVIMLSLRSKTTPVTVGGGTRYPVCIAPPLSGDDACGNGPRFFHSSIDVRSTQTLEQFLGTLGQTTGYTASEERGGEAWFGQLRKEATKTVVVVTDDNARLGSNSFEHFSGGSNPYNSLKLPPGILQPIWEGTFDGYVLHGVYGWGSDNDEGARCTYDNNTQPPSPGLTYTELVKKTGGVRAQICAGAAAWEPFFEAVAQAVWATSKLSCELAIPAVEGTLDKNRVNVLVAGDGDAGETQLYKVQDAAACDEDGGWYYDDEEAPAKVLLCPASCALAQAVVGADKTGRIEVMFGCQTLVK